MKGSARRLLQKVFVDDLVAPPNLVIDLAPFVPAYRFAHPTVVVIGMKTPIPLIIAIAGFPPLVHHSALGGSAGSQAKDYDNGREDAFHDLLGTPHCIGKQAQETTRRWRPNPDTWKTCMESFRLNEA